MRKLIPITLALLLTCLTTTVMADQSSSRRSHEGYSSQGKRIERHLDAKGDRIERRFDQKAVRAAQQGKYRQAYHFERKGRQINRHLDRKGASFHDRIDHRGAYHQDGRHHPRYPRVIYPVYGHVRHDDYARLVIQQPGLWFSWGRHN
jgi:hypothetical protein